MSENTDAGASFSEQLLESARRNNTELLLQIKVDNNNDNEKLAKLINTTKEVISDNSVLHIAAKLGNWEFMDIILDIEGVEIDPKNREGYTPLHYATQYCAEEPEHGLFVVDNLLDAGSDPRITNNFNLKPIDYAAKDNDKLRELLESAEYAITMEIPDDEQLDELAANSEEGGDASGSESE